MVGNRFHLPIGLSGTYHEVVGNGGKRGDIQDEDVAGFLLKRALGDSQGLSLGVVCDRSPPEINYAELYRIPPLPATAP